LSSKPVSRTSTAVAYRRFVPAGILAVGLALALAMGSGVLAQSVEARHWRGTTATIRQPEQVVAGTQAEWRALWGRVGLPAPDMFEQGRMNAVGIFLGRRGGEGYAVNVLSTSRRRDRIVIVFEERMPPEIMLAQRTAPRPVASGPSLGGAGTTLGPAGPGSAGFAASGSGGAASLPPAPSRPIGQPTSPWAIILIHRADLPITVEQRLFR
jgi:hypothetical protein